MSQEALDQSEALMDTSSSILPSTTISRHITTNDPKSGTSVFHKDIPTKPPHTPNPAGWALTSLFATSSVPVTLTSNADLTEYTDFTTRPPVAGGSTGMFAGFVDFPPGHKTPMHRTVNVVVNIVFEGEVELTLDSGETRLLKKGDSVVQRSINHAWRNVSETEWVRLVSFSVPAVVEEGIIGGS